MPQSSWTSTVLLSLSLLAAPAARAQSDQSAFGRAVELTTAASIGDRRRVEEILAGGHPVNTPTSSHRVPLMSAAGSGQLEIVKLLLAKGADPLLEDDGGRTAREYAVQEGHADVARLLDAAERGQPLPDIRANTSGKPNYQQAVELYSAAMVGDLAAVRRILATQQDPNFPVGAGTALHGAASYGQLEVVRELLRAGADPKLQDRNGRTPLDRARAENHADVVSELLAAMGLPPEAPRRRQPPPAAAPNAPTPNAPAPNAPAPNAPAPNAPAPKVPAPAPTPAPTGARPRPGRWIGEITNRYVGKQTIEFTVSADGARVEDVKFRGYWLCRSGLSSSTDTKDLVNLDPPGAFAVAGGAFAGEQREPKSRMFWSLQGQFTSATTATGKYRAAYAGAQCDTWGYTFTARPR